MLAYAGVGTALGLGGPEICGATTNTTDYGIASLLLSAGAFVTVRKFKPHS